MLGICVGSVGVGICYAAMPTVVLENVSRAKPPPAWLALGRLHDREGGHSDQPHHGVAPGTPEIPAVDAFGLCFVVGAVGATPTPAT
ncbi:hypothetical protein ACFYTQ_23725 [Nocardia sp. NPDC004068]|uniref:hypothetical protein n=1 Tax=Nocardia sp. NPDC004068 TaxID=3364303 RepID=UPI0036C5A561